MEQIVLATGNKGKIREFSEAFSHLSIDCIPVKEVVTIEEPEETGTTFMENALLKAHYYAKATNRPCLADDSGITVDALNGAPGVYSARYAGHHGDDQANNEKLIRELQGKSDRTGHYVCALALVYPDGREVTAEGYCDGLVQDEPKGDNGFGYDPLFFVPKKDKTFAQMTTDEKNEISHRGNVVRELLKVLPAWLEQFE